jgi:hypothetical protein
MSWVGKVLRGGVRVGTAWASGGASEAYRARMHKADPVTAYGEGYATKAGNAIDHAVTKSDSTSSAPSGETPEEKEARLRREAAADKDVEAARAYRDRITGEPTPLPREAPEVGAPPPITAARAGAPTMVTSTFDSTNSDQGRADAVAQEAYLRSVMEGKAGPSAAQLAMRRGNAEAIAAQSSLAAGDRGYGSASRRLALRNVGALQQQNVAQTGELAAQEQAQARQEYANLVLGTRGQDITVESTKSAQSLDAARANQAALLQTDLANAGFDQAAILKMSDQQLAAAVANAGFKLTQQQIDDLRAYQQRQQQLLAQGQVLDASGAQTRSDTQAGLTRAEIEQKYQEAKARGDAADEAFWGDLLTKYATRSGGKAA